MAVTISTDTRSNDMVISWATDQLDPDSAGSIVREAIKELAKAYAEQWLEDNIDEVYKNINAKAMSNLILMEASSQVSQKLLDD